MMAETFADFFNELLYGAGAWFGLLIIVAICLLLVLAWKYASVITFPISLLMAIDYTQHNLIWQAIIMTVTALFSLIYLMQKVKHQ